MPGKDDDVLSRNALNVRLTELDGHLELPFILARLREAYFVGMSAGVDPYERASELE